MAGKNRSDVFFKKVNMILYGGYVNNDGRTENARNKNAEIDIINKQYMKYRECPSKANFENLKLKIIKLYSSAIDIFLRADIKAPKSETVEADEYVMEYSDEMESDSPLYSEVSEDGNRICSNSMADSASDLFYTVLELLKDEKTVKYFNPEKMDTFFNYFHRLVVQNKFRSNTLREELAAANAGIRPSRSNEVLVQRVNNILKDMGIQKSYNNLDREELNAILGQLRAAYNDYKTLTAIKLQRRLLEHYSTAVSTDSPAKDSDDDTPLEGILPSQYRPYGYTQKIQKCLFETIELLRNTLKAEKAENCLAIAVFNVVCEIVQTCSKSAKISYEEVFDEQKEAFKELLNKYNIDNQIILFIEQYIKETGELPKDGNLAKYLNIKQYDISRLKKTINDLNLRHKINTDLADYSCTLACTNP